MTMFLHVEDDEAGGQWIDDYIRSEGYDVILARDPREAKRAILRGQGKIDGIIADLHMKDPDADDPDRDDVEVGIMFLYWVRQQPNFKDIPIIVLSRFANEARMPGWKHLLNITDVLQKPTTGQQIGQSLAKSF